MSQTKKKIKANIELYKELKDLWEWLGFCIFMNNWKKASITCDKIDKLKQHHCIINFFAYQFRMWSII